MATRTPSTNPYIAGRALGQDRGFYGRADVLSLVEATLRKPEQNALVLFGQRRIGKTSVLLQIRRRLPSPPFLTVYFDLMDRARQPLGQVLHDIAAAFAAEAGMPAPAEPFDDAGVSFRKVFLPSLYEVLGEGQTPVLLLDEFDVLDVAAAEQLPAAAAAQSFFPYLRELLEGEPRLRFVFVVGRRAEDLSINVKATFKGALYQRISVLEEASARDLILAAERQDSLRFDPAAVARIQALTAGQPYLIQLLCQTIWDSAYAGDPADVPRIDDAAVETAAARALDTGQNVFEWIWDGLPPAERVISAAIAGATDEHRVIGEDQLVTLLQSRGIRILTRELELAPATLVRWEMLRQVDGGYRFFIELMRRWVAARKPLPQVKDELDRLVPLADTLYRSADAFYRHGDAESAEDQLVKALRANPNHLKARLLLGQVRVEQGDLAGAVQVLEEAFRYDEDAGRYPLVRALLALGGASEHAGDDDAALAAYGRALELSPREAVAQERSGVIWLRRGDAAMLKEDAETALAAYRQAGASQKVAEAEALAASLRQRWPAGPAARRRWTLYFSLGVVAVVLIGLVLAFAFGGETPPAGEVATAAPTVGPEPTTAQGYLDRGVSRLAQGDADGAIADFTEALALDPGLGAAYYQRGLAHYSQEEWDGALADFGQAIRLDPNDAAAYRGRGYAYSRMGQNSRAFAEFDEAIRIDPNDAENYYARGNLHIDLGDFGSAIADLTEAIRLKPDYMLAYYERGNARAFDGDDEGALPDFGKAIELDPSFSRSYERRGRALYKLGRYEEAIVDLNRAIELNPARGEALYWRGKAHAQRGDNVLAIADLERALQTEQNDDTRAEIQGLLQELQS